MHSLFLSIFIIISSIQISLGTIISSEINQSFALINNKLIGNSIELDDILESGNYGFTSLKFNKEKLKFIVEHTLKDNYPNINYNIHYYLFQDVYPFAGKYRIVNIEKNHYGFADYQLISQKIDEELLLMHQDSQTISSKYEFACHLARYYVELLAIHPFREGNGRSIREFIREYAIEQSKKYSFGPCDFLWSNVDTNTINETIQFSLAYRSFIELQFLKALVSLSFDEKIRVER